MVEYGSSGDIAGKRKERDLEFLFIYLFILIFWKIGRGEQRRKVKFSAGFRNCMGRLLMYLLLVESLSVLCVACWH